MNWGNILNASAVQKSGKPALLLANHTVSYEQLDRSTTALARSLLREGCRPGDRGVRHWPNSIEMVQLLFGCFKAGIVAVPVYVQMKASEIAYVLGHSQAVLCFSHPDLAPVAREAARDCASLRGIHTSLEGRDKAAEEFPLPEVNDDDPALVLYTSGTTARPKGVTHTHRTLQEMAKLQCSAAPDSIQVVLILTQMAFISAFAACLLPAVRTGATSVLVPVFDAPLVLDSIERFQCTYTFGLPSMLQFLIEEQARKPRNVNSLRTFFAAGDSVPVRAQERFRRLFGIPVRELHGMTEFGASIVNPTDAIRPGSLGKALEGVQARVVDANGNDVADGQSGEIIVRSPGAFVGYWDNPAATKEAVRDGWLYTGDLGRRDADAFYWFEGRKKEIIVRGGMNIAPQEVEEVLYGHPAVLEVATIGLPDPLYGEKIVAFVALRDGRVADEQELREYASQRLADFKVPEKIVFLPNLPKGLTGKVQRRALKELASATVQG
jgi:long-chain acyl-CoA synthetase